MIMNDYLDPRKSLILYGLNEKINFFIKLYSSKKFPHILMLSGEKGSGKFTLINHFLTYIFDKDNYNIENYTINNQTSSILNSFPDITLAAILSQRLLQQLTRLIVAFNSFNRVKPSLLTIYKEIFNNDKQDKNFSIKDKYELNQISGNIEFQNVDFNYFDRKLFNNINFHDRLKS